MIYKNLAEILHLDDERFNESHINAINKVVAHGGSAQITTTLTIKKSKGVLYAEVAGEDVYFQSFDIERKVKVSRPIPDGKEQVALGYVKKKVYLDQDGEVVTRDELPISEEESVNE